MIYHAQYRVSCYHKPSQTWPSVFGGTTVLRARSTKDAINKVFKKVGAMPGHVAREGHPDWSVEVEVVNVRLVGE